MVKRLWGLLLAGMMLCSVWHCACAQEVIPAEVAYAAKENLQVAASADGLWLYEGDTLKWFAKSAYEPTVILEQAQITKLAADHQSALLWYMTEEGGVQALQAVYTNGITAQSKTAIANHAVVRKLVANSIPYALDQGGQISSVYPADGSLYAMQFEDWNNRDVTDLALWDQYLLAYKADSGQLSALDLSTKRAVFPPVKVEGLRCIQLADITDTAGFAIALNKSSQMVRIDLTDGTQTVLNTALPDYSMELWRDEHTLYTLNGNGRTLYALSINDLLGRQTRGTLTVVDYTGEIATFDKAVELFHARYPDMEVVQRRIEDGRVIATEIMGGGKGIDIVGLQDSMMSVSSALLLRSGALLDLNQFPELVQVRQEYRDIFGCLTAGDEWYAVANSFEQHPWKVNTLLLSRTGFDWQPPEGRWTWADFMALADKVKAWNASSDTHIYLLQDDNFHLPYFFQEYQANHIDLTQGKADYLSEGYVELVRMWKQLNDDGLIYQSPMMMMNQSMHKNTLLYAKRTNFPLMGTGRYILPPTETLTARYPVYGYVMALNANTPYLEEAVHFLACYMSPQAESQGFYWNDGQWLQDASLYAQERQWGDSTSEENERLWNHMLTQGAPEFYLFDISRQQSQTLLPAVLEGTISPEEFAAVSQQLADMALGE